tara:strand:+ start:8009 stop:9175 length:1167 start_codon:yes stop_codon:yes gene_type:complete
VSQFSTAPFDSVEEAVNEIAKGNLVIVTDDKNRENEGDIVMAASEATPEKVNMMIQHARGLVCVPTQGHQLRMLGLNPMVQENLEVHSTDFTVSVDAADGITTGISAYDRAVTIRLLADSKTTPEMLVRPGHVFPLRARSGGVLERAGHTEAIVDLASLAGLPPAGVICEILNEDGSCARLPQLVDFKQRFGLKMISIADLIIFRHQRERLVEEVANQPFLSDFGEFQLRIFRNVIDGAMYYALVKGEVDEEPTLVRVQAENLLSDLFRESGRNGGRDLILSLDRIEEEGCGVVLYLEKPNGGLSFDRGVEEGVKSLNTTPFDFRDYGMGAQILAELGLKKIRLLSNTTRKIVALEGYGLEIVENVSLEDRGNKSKDIAGLGRVRDFS